MNKIKKDSRWSKWSIAFLLVIGIFLACPQVCFTTDANDAVPLYPYSTTHYDVYDGTDPDNYYSMMGVHYLDGLVHTAYAWGASASYNLKNQYELVTFEVGSLDGDNSRGHDLKIYLDGEEYMSIDLNGSMSTKEVRINTKGISSITLGETDYDQGRFVIRNVLGYQTMPSWYDKYEEFTAPEDLPATAGTGVYDENGGESLWPYQCGGFDAMDGSNPRESFLMMGEEYTVGLMHKAYGWGSHACFNLGKKYDHVSFEAGHVDDGGNDGHRLTIYLDGEEYERIDLKPDMATTLIELDTKDITQMVIVELDSNQAMYGFVNFLGFETAAEETEEAAESVDNFSDPDAQISGSEFQEIDDFEGMIIIEDTNENSEDDSNDTETPIIIKGEEGEPEDDLVVAASVNYVAEGEYGIAEVALNVTLTNWATEEIEIIPNLSARLTYRDDYTYDADVVFDREYIGMMGKLNGQLVFHVPDIVALSGPEELVLTLSVQGEEDDVILDLTQASKALRDAVIMPFSFSEAASDKLQIYPGNVSIRSTYSGETDESECYFVQDLSVINWSTESIDLNNEIMTGYIRCLDKYGFPGSFEYPSDMIEPLQVLKCEFVAKTPVTVKDLSDEDVKLWIINEDYEYLGSINMKDAVTLGIKYDLYSPGSSVSFGHYEQDNDGNNGAEPIVWTVQVMDIEGEKILLVADNVLDIYPYHHFNENITWENCDLREWLESDFLQEAFDEEELSKIVTIKLDNSPEQGFYSTYGGNDTEDRIFCLSYKEVMEYFPDEKSRFGLPTSYAASNCNHVRDGHVIWATRSPGETGNQVMRVNTDATITPYRVDNDGYYTSIGIRPAIWLDLKKLGKD